MVLKKILQYGVVVLLTFVLLEVTSYFTFQLFTEKKFSHSKLYDTRASRISLIQSKLGNDTDSKTLYVFHPYLGYIGRPGGHPWPKGSPPFNEYGMLSVAGHSYPYKKSEDEFVVAVVGGSVAEIFANQDEELMNNFLRGRLGFQKKLVFINLATGGYKQPQQLFHLQYALLAGFEFDAVLNIDGFNDLVLASENIANSMSPVFPSGYRFGLVAKSHSCTADYLVIKKLRSLYHIYENELKVLSLIHMNPFSHSVFLNLLGELYSAYSKKMVEGAKYELTVKAPETLNDEFRGPTFSTAEVTPYETVAEIWRKSSEMLHAVCERNDILYIHVLQPNQYVEGSKPMSEQEKEIAIDLGSAWGKTAREGYSSLVLAGEELRSSGIAFYDLTMIFKDYEKPLYIDSCCHFGLEGNILLGRYVANILVKELSKKNQ